MTPRDAAAPPSITVSPSTHYNRELAVPAANHVHVGLKLTAQARRHRKPV
jgi:hypothetical protein